MGDTTFGGTRDAFVAKFSAAGVLQWSTYLGGSGADTGFAVAVDSAGAAHIGGNTGTVGQWNLRPTATAGGPDAGTFVYNPGTSPYPVVGDWDANGTSTVGVKTGTTPAVWNLNNANDASTADITFNYGSANDLPVVWGD